MDHTRKAKEEWALTKTLCTRGWRRFYWRLIVRWYGMRYLPMLAVIALVILAIVLSR